MSGIARLLLRLDYEVSGSDLKETNITRELKRLGAVISIGHSPGNIKGSPLVVYSSAIREDNPEIIEARRLGLTVIKRAQALAELMQNKTVIAIAGSHGKTTTASLVSCLLFEAGLSPTVAVGGILKNIDSNACMGSGEFFVAEADESDGSFLYYKPNFSIITNIDHEHLDYYGSFEGELEAFRNFIGKTAKGGCVFFCNDDINLKQLAGQGQGKIVSFGLSPDSDIYPENISFNGLASEFDCFLKDKFVSRFSLGLGGRHNISNALSVIALGLELGIEVDFIKKALSGYKGAGRRLETKFKDMNFTILDDYAHHPTEIKATLGALLGLKGKRRVVIFQPHRFSRTKLLLDDFAKSFDHADILIITDIYAAGEEPILGIDSRLLYLRIKEHARNKEVYFMPKEEIVERVLNMIRPLDIIITLGAGDIVRTADELAERLNDKTQLSA